MTRGLAVTLPVIFAAALWAGPGAAQDNRDAGSQSGGGRAAPAPAPAPAAAPAPAPAAAPAPAPASSGGSSAHAGGRSAPAGGSQQSSDGGGGGARAVPRGDRDTTGKPFDGQPRSRGEATSQPAGDRTTSGGRARPADSTSATSGDTTAVPPYSRPRNGRPATGDAVERRPVGGVTPPIYVDGGYYPWGWGGLAFGGYYDPWLYGSYGSYPSTYPSSYSYGYEGALRLKVKPRAAQVYVDGYYAGEVDEFDGMFQRLHLDAGPHRIEVRLDGYEMLNFDVNIQPDKTVTYKGEMGRLP